MNEKWKPIHGYENYSISNFGLVMRTVSAKAWPAPRMMAQSFTKVKYFSLTLWKNGEGKRFLVHRLVAEAFIGPRPPGMTINHKSGDTRDNHADNLEYCTPGDNSRHAARLGLLMCGEKCWAARLTAEAVIQIRREVRQGMTHADAGRRHGVGRKHIWQIVTRKRWKHLEDQEEQR